MMVSAAPSVSRSGVGTARIIFPAALANGNAPLDVMAIGPARLKAAPSFCLFLFSSPGSVS